MIAVALTKRCSKCGEEKPVEAFQHLKSSPDFYRAQCKVCRHLEYREANPLMRWSKDKSLQVFSLQLREGPEEKVCCQCGLVQPMSQFYKHPRGRKGVTSHCRQCILAANKAERAANPGASRRSLRSLLRKYGLCPEEYARFRGQQNDCCAVCGTSSEQADGGKLDVDHDHATRKVRALLCGKCNRGLGHFNDDPALLEAAATYLRKHHGQNA
jgi:hypothetical protein